MADGNAIFRAGLSHILRAVDDDLSVLEASTPEEMNGILTSDGGCSFDLVVADTAMASQSPGELISRAERRGRRPLFVLIGTDETPATAHRALSAGARGFIGKETPPQVVVQAIRLVLAGGIYLPPCLLELISGSQHGSSGDDGRHHPTERQRQVLAHLARGSSNKEIARAIGLSESAVKTHLAAMMRMVGARNRTDAVLRATERGWLAGIQGDAERAAPPSADMSGSQPTLQL